MRGGVDSISVDSKDSTKDSPIKNPLESSQMLDSTRPINSTNPANRADSIKSIESAQSAESKNSKNAIDSMESIESIDSANLPRASQHKNTKTHTAQNPASSGITYIQADATNLSNIPAESIESLSALCSVEHFGLGRYGDRIDPSGWEKALNAFSRVLKRGGRLYFSVPVGREDFVCFNAHRVFRPETIIAALKELEIVEMSYVEGFDTRLCMERVNGKLITHKTALESIPRYKNFGTTGLFEFVKK